MELQIVARFGHEYCVRSGGLGADCQVVSRDKALQEMLSSWIQNETPWHILVPLV